MFEKLKALLQKLGLDISGKEDLLKTEVEKLEDVPDTPVWKELHKNTDPAVAALVEQNKILLQSVKDLQSTVAKEQTDRAAAMEAIRNAVAGLKA